MTDVPTRAELLNALDTAAGVTISHAGPALLEKLRQSSAETRSTAEQAATRALQAGPTGPAGRGFTTRGAWTSGTAYAADDVVTYAGGTYRVRTAHIASTNALPPAATGTYEVWAAPGAPGGAGRNGVDGTNGTDGADAVLDVVDYDDPNLTTILAAVPVGGIIAIRGPEQT